MKLIQIIPISETNIKTSIYLSKYFRMASLTICLMCAPSKKSKNNSKIQRTLHH